MSEKTTRREQKLGVKISDQVHQGVYANQMVVAHSQYEFVLDFLVTFPPGPQVVTRVVTSPGHMKRMVQALEDNLRQYEEKYGSVEPSPGADPTTVN